MSGPSRGLVGLGAGLAAAGLGAALGLVAERRTIGRVRDCGEPEPLGTLRGTPRTVRADDGTSLYVEVDEAADPPGDGGTAPLTVVFSHGFCLNQDSWHFQRQALRGRYRMVFWDQRGHGRSELGPAGSCTVDRCGRDLRQVIDAVAPTGPLVLVGHSMGGMTVMALAADDHELIRRRAVAVALVSTSAAGLAKVHWGLTQIFGRFAHRLAPGALAGLARAPRLVDRSRQVGSDLEQVLVKRYSYASRVPPSLVRFTADMIAATPIEVVAEYLPTFDLHDKREALAVLDGIESLVLSGADDLLTPPEHSDEIVQRMPGAEHVVVPDAGHLVMLEHPKVVTAHLEELIARGTRALARPRRRSGRTSSRSPRRAG